LLVAEHSNGNDIEEKVETFDSKNIIFKVKRRHLIERKLFSKQSEHIRLYEKHF
jgi:hypothetical protein